MQGMTVAKWSLESGQTEAGLETLTAAVHEGRQLVSGLIRRASMGDSTELTSAPATPTASTSPIQAAHRSDPQALPDERGSDRPGVSPMFQKSDASPSRGLVPRIGRVLFAAQ